MPKTVLSSSSWSSPNRFPTQDSEATSHLTGKVVLTAKYYDISATRFAIPDTQFNGFGADGNYYTAGVAGSHTPAQAVWSQEAQSATRGTLGRFPDRIWVIGTEAEVVILDADSFAVWMRFLPSSSGTNGSFLGLNTTNFDQVEFDADYGVLYVVAGGTLRVADFRLDRMAMLASTGSTITHEPDANETGSIDQRNVADVMTISGVRTYAFATQEWNLEWFTFSQQDVVQSIALSKKLIIGPITLMGRQTLAVGMKRGFKTQASGLPTLNAGWALPDRIVEQYGPAALGGIVQGTGGTIIDDDGDDTGFEFIVVQDFIAAGVVRGMLLSGSAIPDVQEGLIQEPFNGFLTLETEVGVQTVVGAWEVLPNVTYMSANEDGSLGILAGHRLIHSEIAWRVTSGSTVLNPSSTTPSAELPALVETVYKIRRIGSFYYVLTEQGVYRSTVTPTSMTGFVLCYCSSTTPSVDPLYPILGLPLSCTDIALDPVTANLGVVQSDLPFVDATLAPAPGLLTYIFGGGGDTFTIDIGYGDQSVVLTGGLSAAAVVAQLTAGLPGSKWTLMGAGVLRCVSLVGDITVASVTATNAILGFSDGQISVASTAAVLSEIETTLQQLSRTFTVPSHTKVTHGITDSLIVSATLPSLPSPMTIEIFEPGGQKIYDDGLGKLVQDIDTAVATVADYTAKTLDFQWATTPTGAASVTYQLASGVAHVVVGFRNPAGPPEV